MSSAGKCMVNVVKIVCAASRHTWAALHWFLPGMGKKTRETENYVRHYFYENW